MDHSHTQLALLALKSRLGYVIPRAFFHSEVCKGSFFFLRFSLEGEVTHAHIRQLEETVQQLRNGDLVIREMLVSNAKEYLREKGAEYEAATLNGSNKQLCFVVEIGGALFVSNEPLAPTLWPVKIVGHSKVQQDGRRIVWEIAGVSCPSKQEVQAYAKGYRNRLEMSYQQQGAKMGLFSYGDEGTMWHEKGLRQLDTMRDFVRAAYTSLGMKEVRTAHSLPEGTFMIAPSEDSLFFPATPCYSDFGLAAEADSLPALIEAVLQRFPSASLREVKEKREKVTYITLCDVWGEEYTMSEFRLKKRGLKISLCATLERALAFTLEERKKQ